jgi:hypothetical protein
VISEKLSAIYSALEDKFYAFFDFLEEKGLPVYGIIDPIEEKGIPFFPLTIAIIAILLASVFGFGVMGTSVEAKIELNLRDSYGEPLRQVNITVEDSTGKQLFYGTKNHGDEITLNVQAGTELTFKGEKKGYERNETTTKIINKETAVNLNLKKLINTIKARIKFYDKETETSISDVYATIEWKGIQKDGFSDKQGLIEFLDVPIEEDLLITASSDSYYEFTGTIRFESEETKSIYLTPKEIAFTGESNLIITLFDEKGNLLKNAKIKVYSGNDLLDEKIVTEGVYSENFPKGSVVRFTAEKEGFKLYESSEFTLREEEENFGSVQLERGGKEVKVKVIYSDTKNPVVGAEVTLFNSKNEIIDSVFTLYEGETTFKGLNKDENYFVGATKENYLPAIQRIERETEEIELTKENALNSSELTVMVIDSRERPVENASLYFTKFVEDTQIPLGIKAKKTDSTGKFKLKVPLNEEITVKAVKDLSEGTSSLLIGEYNNNMLIKLKRKDSIKTIKFFDEKGQIKEGHLTIKGKNNEILFDDEITEETIFDAGENNFVEIELTTKDGKKYTEEISLEENDIRIDLDSIQRTEKTPSIEFIGIFDLEGNEVEGITKGKEFILKFKTEWMKGTQKGGVHFRTGNDSIKYADSEDIGITGFDATGKYFYGKSYSPNPSPGNKAIDYSNKGEGGKLNKFIELYFDKPEGTKIIKVRIKARELIKQEKIKVKYRAWSEINGKYHRNPVDSILGNKRDSQERHGLYAETHEIEIKVYDSEPQCSEEVCIEYVLMDSKERKYDKKEFFALKNRVYAIEIRLQARKATEASIKLSTSSENPKIAFTGKEVNSFTQFIDNNKSDTSIEFKVTAKREGTKTRVYFKAKTEGESFIKSIIVTPKNAVTENFYFEVFKEKEMSVNVSKTILEGEDFEVIVRDEKGKGIENAIITFYDLKGRIQKTVQGNEFNGRNGRYEIENTFKAGNYLMKINAPKFREKEKEIKIVFGEGLEIQESIKVNIAAGELFGETKAKIRNLTGKAIENLSAEIIPAKNFPKEFKLKVNVPLALNAGEESEVSFLVEYSGNKKVVLHGETEVILTGEIKGIPIKTKTRVVINYNQKLSEECLEFDRKELKEYLIGAGGNSKQIDLGIKNNCNVPLQLTLEFIPKGHSDKEIEFSVSPLRIEKNEIKNIKINAINKIQRNYVRPHTLEYDVFFKSSQLTKSIPLKIVLWNELFSLSVTPAVVLWVTQSRKEEKGIAAQPIYIRNTGFADIEHLRFALQFHKPKNTQLKVLWGNTPIESIPPLRKGMALIPPAVIQAETTTTENQKIAGKLRITGTIHGREYLLREINVFVNVSAGWGCLEAWSDDLLFSSATAEYGSIEKTLNITNNCTEPVIIKEIQPAVIGGNEIVLMNPDYILSPGESEEFIVRLIKNSESNQKTKIQVTGIGMNTREIISSMPTEIEIAIGKGTGICGSEEEPCKGENETVLEYCDGTGTATVYFPKQSSNCSEGYCDAEELAKFLGEKFREEIRKAQLRINEIKSVENLGSKCNLQENYCSFGAMGITTSKFDFYFKNDNLTKELLKKEIEKLEVKELQHFIIRIGETENELYSSAGHSFGEHLLLIPPLRGCGKYSAKILGAAALSGREIRENSITLLLKIENGREETPECYNRIQNFVNFIPVDESYSPDNSKGSWLTVIERDPDFEEIQKSFSKTLFNDERGVRVTTTRQNNYIRFTQGNFNQEQGIIKIAMQRKGESNEPKTIDVYITNDFFSTTKEIMQDIALEAGKIISNLKHGRIEKGCISKNADYLILGSVKDLSEIANLKWKDKEKIFRLYPERYNCVDLELESKIEAPEIEVKWSLVNEELQGIEKESIQFKYKNGEEITNAGERSFNLSRGKWKEKGNNYSLEFQLCAKGTENAREAIGSKIKLEIAGLKDKELEFGVCAITPFEFMERSQAKEHEGKWFALIDWKGEPQKIEFQTARLNYYYKHPKKDPTEIRKKELYSRKTIKVIGYGAGALAGCMALGIGLSAFTGGYSVFECILNAGIPTALGLLSKEEDFYGTTKGALKRALASLGVTEEIETLQKETGIENEREFLTELEKIALASGTAKETIKLAFPVGTEAKEAAIAAKEAISTTEIEKELTEIAKEISSYNRARNTLSKTGIESIGYFPEGSKHAGKYFIDTETKRLIQGTKEFETAKTKIIESLKKLKLNGKPINAERVLNDAFVSSPGKATKVEWIIQDIAEKEGGLLERIEGFKETIKTKAGTTKQGKALLKVTEEYTEKAASTLSEGKNIRTIAKGRVLDALKAKNAISTESKLKAILSRHPKIKRLGRGGIGIIGAMAGGAAGWALTSIFMGELEEIPVPEAEFTSFEKGFTYQVKIGKNSKGKATYKYSKVKSQDLALIPLERRLDSDACTRELPELNLNEILNELETQ